MLKFTPILLAILYALAMYRFSVWRTQRELDARSTELADPMLKVLTDRMAEALGLGPGDSLLSSPETLFDLAGVYPLKMKVVGVLARSYTPDDRAVLVDLTMDETLALSASAFYFFYSIWGVFSVPVQVGILIAAPTVSITGKLSAAGAPGTKGRHYSGYCTSSGTGYADGGAGGKGRIHLLHGDSYTNTGTVTANDTDTFGNTDSATVSESDGDQGVNVDVEIVKKTNGLDNEIGRASCRERV